MRPDRLFVLCILSMIKSMISSCAPNSTEYIPITFRDLIRVRSPKAVSLTQLPGDHSTRDDLVVERPVKSSKLDPVGHVEQRTHLLHN